jgi:hypothetical protein
MILAACSSGGSHPSASTASSTPASTSTTPPPSGEVTTAAPVTTAPVPSTTPAPAVTTTVACANPGGSTAPFTTPPPNAAALLTSVTVSSAGCADRLIFGFVVKTGGNPACRVAYAKGPFSQDGSGATVTVLGTAFVVVRCSPAYGYDFESGRTTYTGPKRITPSGMQHVREIVETGDNEGVLTWVVGLDSQRPFRVIPARIPPGVSTLAIIFS